MMFFQLQCTSLLTKETIYKMLPSLKILEKELKRKSKEFNNIVKIGRTHLQDATPLSLGQEFSGYHFQVKKSIERIEYALKEILFLAQGGTAVGTGINAPDNFGADVASELQSSIGIPLKRLKIISQDKDQEKKWFIYQVL